MDQRVCVARWRRQLGGWARRGLRVAICADAYRWR